MTQVLSITVEIMGRPWEGGPWGYEKSERFPAALANELQQCYPNVTYIRVRDAGGIEGARGRVGTHVEIVGDEDLRGGTVAFAEAMQSEERVAVREAVTALARSLWIENQWISGGDMEAIMSDRLLAMIDKPYPA